MWQSARGRNRTPYARVFLAATQTLTTATITQIVHDTVSTIMPSSVDHWGMWDTANKGRLFARIGGLFVASGSCGFAAATDSTRRIVQLRINGTTVVAQNAVPAIATAGVTATVSVGSGPIVLEAGDYVDLAARQDTGGNLATVAGDTATWLSLAYAGPR